MTIDKQLSHTNAILGTVALMLIVLPMSVFAQTTTTNTDSTTGGEIATTSSEKAVTVKPVVDQWSDNYRREELPHSNKVFSDFVVGPGRFTLEVAPGESKTVFVNISNRLGSKRLFALNTEDMTAGGDENEGTIKLLGDQVGPYTIKDYISVPYDHFYIDNNERVVVPVTISIPDDAEPGGFYGSILTEVMPDGTSEKDSEVAPTTPLVTRIGTLFYVTTPGETEEEGSLLDFTTIPNKSFYISGPVDMGLVYENTGSVHLTPYGNIIITNILGDTVGQVELDPWYVMPKSVRTREISWDREFLFGRYTVTADIERGYGNNVDTRSLVVWIVPWKMMVTVFAGVFIFFLILRFIMRNFEFKHK